jgi:hypothetical protein
MRKFLAALALSVIPAMAADIYTFTVPQAVTFRPGPPGVPVVSGWGYTIHNESASDWLVTTNLTAGTFQNATPDALFTYPDIAPGQTVTVPFLPLFGSAGLYQIVWDTTAPAGFVNSGTFTLGAQWWTADPTKGGTLIGNAPNTMQNYSASPTPAPEPASLGLLGLPLLAIALLRFRRPRFQ